MGNHKMFLKKPPAAKPTDAQKSPEPDRSYIRTVPYWQRYSLYPSEGLTPGTLSAIHKEADQGNLFRQSMLQEDILEKEPRLMGMVASRRLAVTKRKWEIFASGDSPEAKDQADFCRNVIKGIRGRTVSQSQWGSGQGTWRSAQDGILSAGWYGAAFLQKLWAVNDGKAVITDLEWTHPKNFRWGMASDPLSDLRQPRRLTLENLVDGVELEENKWVVAIIQARPGHPTRTGLCRTIAWNYLFKNFDLKSWIQYAEVFWMPLRKGTYSANATDKDKEALLDALIRIGQDAAALISDTTSIEFITDAQKAATAAIHGELAKFINEENSVAILGHTAAAESTAGKLGQENSAQEVRFDLIESDAIAMDSIINDQIIKPLIDVNYGPQQFYPVYRTLIEPEKDKLQIVQTLDFALNKLRMTIPVAYAHNETGIPQPQDDEDVLLPAPVSAPPLPSQFKGMRSRVEVD